MAVRSREGGGGKMKLYTTIHILPWHMRAATDTADGQRLLANIDLHSGVLAGRWQMSERAH